MKMKPSLHGMLMISIACLWLGASVPSVSYTVLAPAGYPLPGARVEVQVVLLNRSNGPVDASLPRRLTATLIQSERHWEVELQNLEDSPLTDLVHPRGFSFQGYALPIPSETIAGPCVLEIRIGETQFVSTGFEIASPTATTPNADFATGKNSATNSTRVPSAAAALRRMVANRITPHEATYFIYGGKAPAAKFQYSLKYRLLDFHDLGEQTMARSLHFAFTQRSLWDIGASSSPVYDTSYIPELLYESLSPRPEKNDARFAWLGVQAALRHESNGRDGPRSRSLNEIYARTGLCFGQLEGWHLIAFPELHTYVGTRDENPDIAEYRGYGRLQLVVGRSDGPSLALTTWSGRKFNHVSTQVDLNIPVRTKLLDFETYLLVQYFNGYGETLVSYREPAQNLRAGFS